MLTLKQLKENLQKRVKEKEFNGKAVYYMEEPLKEGTELRMGSNRYTVEKDSFLVIIDEVPRAFFEHPVSFELHDFKDSDVKCIPETRWLSRPEQYPPLKSVTGTKEPLPLSFKPMTETATLLKSDTFDVPRADTSHKHAILLGGPDDYFKYDVANMRDVLINMYLFDRDNITILLNDGKTTTDPDIQPDLPATRENLDDLLLSYAAGGQMEAGEADTIFIYIFTHGRNLDGTSYIAMYYVDDEGKETDLYYYDFEMAIRLANIPCGQLIVVMNPCESGAFIPKIIDAVSKSPNGPKKTVVMTATPENQVAWELDLGDTHHAHKLHGGFSYFFYSALNWGFLPSPLKDTLSDTVFPDVCGKGTISMRDAFRWVIRNMGSYRITTLFGYEQPQLTDHPLHIASEMYLGLPKLTIRDEDVFIMSPSAVPTDENTVPPFGSDYLGKTYRGNELNCYAARVFNTGDAPCHNIKVDFFALDVYDFYFGTALIERIDPGCHAYAHVVSKGPSILTIYNVTSIEVRVSCEADPGPQIARLNHLEVEESLSATIRKEFSFLPVLDSFSVMIFLYF